MDKESLSAWYERYFDLDETPEVWPQNRQCLLNVIEHLQRALPVKSVTMDPRILEEPRSP